MITWILLVSLVCVSTQDRNGQDKGVLHHNSHNQTMINSDWRSPLVGEDDPSHRQKRHNNEVAVTPDQTVSYLPVDCASIQSITNQNSPQTVQGQKLPNSNHVFPQERWFVVGSRATFCCVVPEGQTVIDMYLVKKPAEDEYETGGGGGYARKNITRISNQIYALTVDLSWPSVNSCTDVKCKSDTKEYGTCAYIGYPPSVRDLRCETQDLQSVKCRWETQRGELLRYTNLAVYLLGSKCEGGTKRECSKSVQWDAGERNWTLTARNNFGVVEITDKADLTQRVHMFAPREVTVSSINARNVSLKWRWEVPQYSKLNITCQIHLTDGRTKNRSGVGLHFVVLKGLIPHWDYTVKVRCGTAQHFYKWSDWSNGVNFRTNSDVPDALDVWMQRKDRQTEITWKRLQPNQTHGQIIDYEVTWAKTSQREPQSKTKVPHPEHSIILSLDVSEEYVVTVTARNRNGSSSPSKIAISSFSQDQTSVNIRKINGVNGGFRLSWSPSLKASCGYIVDWCPASGNCSVEWMKVHSNDTHAHITSKNFKDGHRYMMSIYACTSGAPVLLERRQGYVREKEPEGLFKNLRLKQQNTDVVISWDPIALREQSAFILGYILYCSNARGVITVRTDKPEATSLTATNLEITPYSFTVKAVTALGESSSTTIDATLNSLTDNLVGAVIISLITTFSLLSLVTFLCYRHWACIKNTVYPPIPKPVLAGTWLMSPDELQVAPYAQTELDNLDIPELHCKAALTLDGFVRQDDGPLVFSQTPKGYYNQPLKKYTPPLLIMPPTVMSSQLPPSTFKAVFPNPLYNLLAQAEEHQPDSGPEHQEDTPSLEICSEYQPQSQVETFSLNTTEEDRDSPISCVTTYIVLPHPSAE
ncbi:leukemia inhibitory factor receptor-like isoform X2 [Sphaeramia orbicularis]|uniref:Leptin receptor n=1 Tax=Sphaeramia orbicularis TaxID=375764 RepID=A0A672YCL5_9TELE|nr:leukemia inhibitory factor receptor-like isoform X2 [Sphaeramia orbicularis]